MPRLIPLAIGTLLPLVAADLTLTYRSAIDDTDQPYRVYVPASYSPAKPIPLALVLHGTGGDHNTFFTTDSYRQAKAWEVAEKLGVLMVFPMARGVTEYRGIGENDCFCVMDEIRKRYNIDPDRVYLTGLSMGGTGAAYLALHHPDLFAAAAPISAAYSWPWLARNAEHVPFLWVGGALDSVFYHRGVSPGVDRMRQYGVKVLSESLPDEGHAGPMKQFERIVSWLLQHKRNPHPRQYYFETDTTLHGRAWWTTITKITDPGRMAAIEANAAEAAGNHTAKITLHNVASFDFHPDPAVFDLSQPIELIVNGHSTGKKQYTAEPAPNICTQWRQATVAEATGTLDMLGTEKTLANWIADAMRWATNADLALWNGWPYRGLPIAKGKVDVVDLIQASRPFDQYLVTVQLTGHDILEMLDANIPVGKAIAPMHIDTPGASRLIQLSGARYVFDRSRPAGQRILSSTIDPQRVYTVALEGQVVERETILLKGRFLKLDYQTTNMPFTTALYGYAARNPRMEPKREGRVREDRTTQ
ncbi:MAG: 5'-nucleotidase C-terminal domain-containing protein [Bryobacterales bacterium]|nr:5'-nucleotidase C-terminal domain-containing protein [Bryobacterales bacterium]